MSKEHLNLLSEFHRDLVLFGLGQIPGNLARIFVLLAGDLARIGVGAAFLLGRADLADVFQGAIAGCAFAGWPRFGSE
mgnify:CR=1 FL=1